MSDHANKPAAGASINEDLSIGEFFDRNTLRLVRHFPHPRQRVWEALSDREQDKRKAGVLGSPARIARP
jgi:hypothetical protein